MPTNDWTYASRGGLEYPVFPGDAWTVGGHVLLCGDLELGAADAALALVDQPPSLIYTDPPWNPGVHRAFRTKAGLGEAASFDELMLNWLIPAAGAAPVTLVEMGKTGIATLLRLAAQAGFRVDGEWDITYFKTTASKLYAFTPIERQPPEFPKFAGLDDSVTPGVAVEALTQPGETVVDFCTGLGFTALAAARLERKFVGSEIHPNRVSATLAQLHKAIGGAAPVKIWHEPRVAASPIYGGSHA